MTSKRTYHIIVGSKAFFDSHIPDLSDAPSVHNFLELVRLFDAAKQQNVGFDKYKANLLVLKNDNYHGIVDSAHDRLGALVEDLTTNNAEVFIHNPPQILKDYLDDQYSRQIIDLDISVEKYNIVRDSSSFAHNMEDISSRIIGQESAIKEISKSLWYLTTVNRAKPYVIMLYGNSSLGKTELVREVAAKFFNGKFLEKHLSMFKNNNYADYFFGDAPNRRSIGFDLLERESNLIFLDELDKCPEHFYSAFYTLFDNTLFKDATYDVDISGTLIVLTSNYQTVDEMKKYLGLPIFYRIDKFIHFDDFSSNAIYTIVMNEIKEREDEYKEKLTPEMIYASVSPMISAKGENARTIKYKIQQVIEDLLFDEVLKERS